MNARANPFVRYSLMTLLGIIVVGSFFSLAMAKFGVAAVIPWIIFSLFCVLLFLTGRWLVKGVRIAKEIDPTAPSKICSVETSYEADMLVAKLEAAGIQAQSVGGFVAGFVAEAPGLVDVVVAQEDLQAATQIIEESQSILANQN